MFNELIESYICLGKIIWGPDMGSSTMDIGLLYAYGFILLTSKALRQEAKNLGRLRLFMSRSEKVKMCFA